MCPDKTCPRMRNAGRMRFVCLLRRHNSFTTGFGENYEACSGLVNVQEDWMGTRSDQLESMSIKSMSLLKPGATRCHGTKIARGVPLPVYINLDLYSGFWCTSRWVVFKYSVPPLTDQALRKVLLTS